MKRLLMCVVIMALVSSMAIAKTNTVPEYRTTELRRVDGGGAKRLLVYVTVGAGLTTNQVRSVIETVVMHNFDEHAIGVSVSEHGFRPSGFTVAHANWAPHGDWSRAMEGRRDPDRETYKLKVEYREPYFKRKTAPKWPAKVGLTWEQVNRMCGELETVGLEAVTKVYQKYPMGNDEALAQARKKVREKVGKKYGLSGDLAVKVENKWMEEIY